MQHCYKLYKKTDDDNLIAAILPAKFIDDITLHIFTNNEGEIDVTTYEKDDIKIETLGRSLWSEVTWEPSKKWTEFTPGSQIDVQKCVDAINNGHAVDDLTLLTGLFNS